jgi:DNA (cytosine-5)-methyltransferase 1
MPTRTTRENDGVAVPPFLVPLRSGRNRSIRADTEPLATVVADGGNHGLAVPPLLVPVEGRDGKEASPTGEPLRTQTARNETGLAWLPFVAELRGGSSDARPVSDALATVTASGNHHGLVAPIGPADWASLLVPYYGTGTARPVAEPVGALSTRDRYALVSGLPPVEDVQFRMLEPHEIGRAMAFGQDYVVIGNKRERVRQYGNAVTPPVAELIVSALVEAITGEALERAA